jgi:long-chain acyl-CoA synthetase
MPRIIFLTGATGFLGTQIMRELLKDDDNYIATLVRAKSNQEASERAARAWWDWPELRRHTGVRIKVLCGDILEPQLGLKPNEYRELVHTTTHIIHTAADLRLDAPIGELRKTNVGGTANIINLARLAHADHGLTRFSHVSTAYVAGAKRGDIDESSLSPECGFSSNYELSKYEGEQLVQAVKSELPVTVLRPGMIVGDSNTGAIKTFNTVYYPIRLYMRRKLRVLPGNRRMKVNMVPVDYVAEAVSRLTLDPRAEGLNFHLVAPTEKLPEAGELLDFVREWANGNLNEKLPPVPWVPVPRSVSQGLVKALESFPAAPKSLLALIPYFNENHRFSRDNSDRLLGSYDFNWRQVMNPILEYAVNQSFLNRSPRTVHEQILFRLRSKSLPVTYHDVVQGKIIQRDTDKVRAEMLQATAALRKEGIGRGDRVALVGFNSTRYLTLDVAIGLVGAVNVPIYYTSPPEEINTILKDSGAKMLFVGIPKILERLGEIESRVPVVYFHREKVEALPDRRVTSWEEFLDLAKGQKETEANSPAGFNSLATIRYTSGTLGEPKGACFDHQNLRWMAQSTASLMPWKARTRPVAYISHLPLNHVVEGMLATYSQYYVQAPVDIYFVENLHDLSKAVRAARPTVFFSIPRFYEKLWDAFAAGTLGKSYVGAKSGSLQKRMKGLFLRPLFLRKSGLGRCLYFLAGSAPPNVNVMRSLQELGIDVHNAYGLTEAPLVTMNRLGANRIGTAGGPLPDTELSFAEDGEIMVRGPQVMRGYLGADVEQPFRDGWLKTGDIGHLTEAGALAIDGRKKEILKTSYGKYIHPGKIESLLKQISRVDEAMVVGDGKPYCTAILWVKNEDANLAKFLDEQISQLNTRLNHPEQIKRWTVLKNNLTIGQGLTANLKLKRTQLASNLGDTISAMYEDKPSKSRDVICVGSFAEGGK